MTHGRNLGVIQRLTASWAACLILCVALLLSLGSCRREETGDSARKDGIRKEFERGPVKVVIEIDHKEISIADKLNFRIEIFADKEYEVRLPQFGEKLEQFGIVDYHTSQPELAGEGKVRFSRSYVLEPFLSGDYAIPAMKIEFWKKPEKESDKEPDKHEMETEEIKIKVKSLLPEKLANLKIHEIAPPVELPRPVRGWIWTGAAVSIVVLGTLVVIILRKRRRRPEIQVAPSVPPHEIAFNELQRLVDEKLIENHKVKLFHQRISDILRRYIERRFSLHAPEQTTEEFLDILRSSEALDTRYRSLLREFLSHCDLVKFAEHQPGTEEIQKTFDSCKSFVLETKQQTRVAS